MRGICRYGFLGSTSLGIHSDRNSYGHNYLNRKSFRTQLCKGFSRLMTIEIISMYTSSQVQVTHPKPLEEKELSCYFLIQALRHSKDSEKVKKNVFKILKSLVRRLVHEPTCTSELENDIKGLLTRNTIFVSKACLTMASNTVRINPDLVGRCCTTRRDTKIVFCVNTPQDTNVFRTYIMRSDPLYISVRP
jgi:hypothetical protein